MRNDCGVDRMTDDEALTLRPTVIAGHCCADDLAASGAASPSAGSRWASGVPHEWLVDRHALGQSGRYRAVGLALRLLSGQPSKGMHVRHGRHLRPGARRFRGSLVAAASAATVSRRRTRSPLTTIPPATSRPAAVYPTARPHATLRTSQFNGGLVILGRIYIARLRSRRAQRAHLRTGFGLFLRDRRSGVVINNDPWCAWFWLRSRMQDRNACRMSAGQTIGSGVQTLHFACRMATPTPYMACRAGSACEPLPTSIAKNIRRRRRRRPGNAYSRPRLGNTKRL